MSAPKPPHSAPGGWVPRSPGVLVAPFADGAIVYDTLTETAHRVGALGMLLLGCSSPQDVEDLVRDVSAETGDPPEKISAAVDQGIHGLTDLGLLGRVEQPEARCAPEPILDHPRAGWTTGRTHTMFDLRFAFCGPDAGVIAEVDRLWGEGTDEEPNTWFGLTRESSDRLELVTDDRWGFSASRWLLWQLPGVLNDYANRTHHAVVLHAGAVRTPAGAVVVVTGPIDAGKSTLTAELVKAGCDYLGDESIAIRGGSLRALSYPKPLTLSPASQRFIGLQTIGEPVTPSEHRLPTEIRADAMSLHGDVGPVDLVLHVRYQSDATTSASPLGPYDALKVLLANTINLKRVGEPGLVTLCSISERVPVLSVTHGDASALARQVTDHETSLASLSPPLAEALRPHIDLRPGDLVLRDAVDEVGCPHPSNETR